MCGKSELRLPKNVFRAGEPILIEYHIKNRSKTLTAEFGVRCGPHVVVAFSVFRAETGERLLPPPTRTPKILGVGNTRMVSPGETYTGTYRLDEEYRFSKAGLYKVVGKQHFAVSYDSRPDSVESFMKYSQPLFIRIND
jgi:hypothetical protein